MPDPGASPLRSESGLVPPLSPRKVSLPGSVSSSVWRCPPSPTLSMESFMDSMAMGSVRSFLDGSSQDDLSEGDEWYVNTLSEP